MGGVISRDAAAEIKDGMIGMGLGLGQGLGLAQFAKELKQAVYALCFTAVTIVVTVMIVLLAYIWRPQSV
jgi:hypothetical protein